MAGLSLPSLKIDILADGSSAIREISGVAAAAQGLEIVGTKMKSFATDKIVSALKSAVSGASDLTETLGKTEVIFGDMTDDVLEWSESSIDAMGLAQSTALDMVALYADMATGMGFTTAEAKNMSTGMTQLAADLASFKNIGIGDVQTKLNGVFTGETEGLKSLGIVMTQANLQQYALTQGITKQISAMTQAEQVQLRYSYVMAMSANAQGDFVRTGDSYANQTRKLKESIKQLSESFGMLLTEKLAGIVAKLQGAVQWVADMDDSTKRMILTIGLVVGAVGPLLIVTGKVVTAVASLKTALAALSANPIILGIMGVTAAAALLAGAIAKSKHEVDKTSDAYKKFSNAVKAGANAKITVDDTEVTSAYGTDSEIEKLKSNIEEIKAKIAVEQDADKRDALEKELADLETKLSGLEKTRNAEIKLNNIDTEINEVKNKIEEIKAKIAITQDPVQKAILKAELSTLQLQLDGLTQERETCVNVIASFQEEKEDEESMERFRKALAEMPKNEEYGGTGKFVISEATEQEINDYATALAAAAAATGDYATAVDNLNRVVDQQKQRKIDEINQQAADEMERATAYLNENVINEQEYDDWIRRIVDDLHEKTAEIEANAEAQKKLNELYNNGNREDDYTTTAEIAKSVYGGAKITEEHEGTALNHLTNVSDSGGDMTQERTEATAAYTVALNEAAAAKEKLTQINADYQKSMAAADRQEQSDQEFAKHQLETGQEMFDFYIDYAALKDELGAGEQAFNEALEMSGDKITQFEGLKEKLRNAFQNDDGTWLEGNELRNGLAGLQDQIDEANRMLTEGSDRAAQMRADATSAATEQVNALNEGINLDVLNKTLDFAEQAGVSINETDAAMIEGGARIIGDLAETLSGGTDDVSGALTTALSGMDSIAAGASSQAKPIGTNMMSGIGAGITDMIGTTSTIISTAVKRLIQAAKDAAVIKSPSHIMRDEVGAMMMEGLDVGVEKATPSAIQTMKKSVEGIISGASAVINKGAYAIPAMPGYAYPLPAGAGALAFDYERLGDEMSRRPIRFAVGSRELAASTRDEAARAQAVRVSQINQGFGGR